MTLHYAVTFESPIHPPKTVKGLASGKRLETVMRRAVEAALVQAPWQHWAKLHVRLDRADSVPEALGPGTASR